MELIDEFDVFVIHIIIQLIELFFYCFWLIIFLGSLVGFIGHVIVILVGLKYLRKKSLNHLNKSELPGVSILKPLKGVDPNLSLNLETFFNMDYPKYELLFCVQDSNDPAIKIAKSLIEKYPKIDAKLILGGHKLGLNPKINNMNPGYEVAKYELVMISDDKIYIESDTLLDMVDCINEGDGLGMVNQIAYFKERSGFETFFEKLTFACGTVKYMLMYKEVVGVNCNGMSSLFRKSVLDMAGGLKCLAEFIVEDNEMSHIIYELGWDVGVCRHLALQNSGMCNIESIYDRLKRWLFIGVKNNPLLHPLVFLGHPTTLTLVHTWSLSRQFQLDSFILIFTFWILLYCAVDYATWIIVLNETFSILKIPKFVFGWILGQFFAYFVTFTSHITSEIDWQGQKFSVSALLKPENLKSYSKNYLKNS